MSPSPVPSPVINERAFSDGVCIGFKGMRSDAQFLSESDTKDSEVPWLHGNLSYRIPEGLRHGS